MRDLALFAQLLLLCVNTQSGVSFSVATPSLSRFGDFGKFCDKRRCAPPVLIDLRSVEEFSKGHIVGAVSIPVTELKERQYELPAPFETVVNIYGDANVLTQGDEILSTGGWTVKTRELTGSVDATESGGTTSCAIWRPNEFLEFFVEAYLLKADIDMSKVQGLVAKDFGCGNGRDTVYIAQKLPQWTVVGLDNHKGALERGRKLAQRSGAKNCEWMDVNLRNRQLGRDVFEADFVHAHRFMDKDLMKATVGALKPGGYFVWSTFAQIGPELNLAPPHKPSRLLRVNELRELFTEGDNAMNYEILHDELGQLNTRGESVPAVFFAARRLS